jgi:hypothetical protein
VSALLHAALATRLERLPAHRRASAYLSLRLAPTAAGALFAGLIFLPAFLLFEPRNSGEQVSAAILALTLLATVPLLRCGREAVAAWRSTRARVTGWLTDAEPLRLRDTPSCPAYVVHAPFPVVAVVGVRRPFLVVSRTVLETCSGDELSAILAHEATHLRRRDNLKRLLMLTTPDLLAGTAAARDMELRWQRASEEAADDGAGSQRSLDLAAALVKVARLAQGLPAPPATMAAFCRGDDIARRVTRLTADRPRARAGRVRGSLLAGLALASATALVLTAGTLESVHAVAELFVTLLQ